MNQAYRRRENRPRPRVEALEGRVLLANAGTPDPAFGGGTGYASISLGVPNIPNTNEAIVSGTSAITLPDGNIVVSETTTNESVSPSTAVLSLFELNANGSVDTGFGIGGEVQLPTQGSSAISALPSGQILVAEGLGRFPNMGSPTYAAVRLNANGALDTTFGVGGVAQYPADTTTPTANRIAGVASVLLESNGQILLVGGSTAGFSAVRLNSDGSLDTTYGTDGTVTVPVTVNGYTQNGTAGVAMQSNGQILVTGLAQTGVYSDGMTGYPTFEIAAFRLNTDGSLDTTYGGSSADGIVLLTPAPTSETIPSGIAIDPTTGQALISGSTTLALDATQGGPLLYRLNTDGTVDTSFGTNGLVKPPGASSLAVQSNGQILLTSLLGIYPTLYRLNADGSADPSFGNIPTPGTFQARTPIFTGTDAVTVEPNGDILLIGLGTVPSLNGRLNSLGIAQVLSTATTGPVAIAPPTTPADFTGQGYTDAAVYDPTTGSFVFITPAPGYLNPTTTQFGIAGTGQTIPAAADYLGLGNSQIGAYLTASGIYAILPTNGSAGLFEQFGIAGAGQSIPVPADYYGTGQADVAVYLTQAGIFAIQDPTGKTSGTLLQFGIGGAGQSIPAPADYYGTGQADIAVYLAQAGTFAILAPGNQTGEVIPFGKPGVGQSIPVPGDYDGSGKTELAVYVPSVGAYFYRPADGGSDVIVPIGTANSGEIPVPGDYDGSGRTEAAVYDPTTGTILYQPANGGPVVTISIGTADNGSLPVAAPAGALPEFALPGSGGGTNAIRVQAIVPSSSSSSNSSAAITVSRASAVPVGPTLASIRVARTLVNQAATDPFKRT